MRACPFFVCDVTELCCFVPVWHKPVWGVQLLVARVTSQQALLQYDACLKETLYSTGLVWRHALCNYQIL